MNAIATTAPTHDEVVRVLQSSLYPGAKRESIELVLSYCKVNQLDPMLKPVHIVPTRSRVEGTDDWESRDTLMPGIALYRILAARSGEYAGKSEPEYGPNRTEKIGGAEVTYPEWCRVTVSRIVRGQLCSFAAKELWIENVALSRKGVPTEMWQKRAFGQLAKCTEAQALRMAFPEYSGGAPTAEEMEGKELGPVIEAKSEAPETPLNSDSRKRRRETINAEVPLTGSWAQQKMAAIDKHKHLSPSWTGAVCKAFIDATSSEEVEQLADEVRQRLQRSTNPEANHHIGAAVQAARKRVAAQPKPPLPAEERLPFPGDDLVDGVPEPIEEEAPHIVGEENVLAG